MDTASTHWCGPVWLFSSNADGLSAIQKSFRCSLSVEGSHWNAGHDLPWYQVFVHRDA